jgi:hypothetical protein
MPTLNMEDQMTALEIARRANAPEPYQIIELMRMTNEMLIDVPAYEANNAVINVAVQRDIKPVGEHRIYNQGVGKAATQTKKIEDRIAVLSVYSEVDALMIDHSGNKAAALMSESKGIIKGMGLTQAQTLIHGDVNKPEEFAGLMQRRYKVDGVNTIDAGGTSTNLDMTSIYLCAIGQEFFHLIYPKGSTSVGVNREDLGRQHVKDDKGGEYPVFKSCFTAQYGVTIKVPDAVKRICNIPKDISGDKLVDIIIEASYKLPKGATTYAMYCNDSILIKLDKAARDKSNVVHTTTDPWGNEILNIRKLRCRQMDVITSSEERVA